MKKILLIVMVLLAFASTALAVPIETPPKVSVVVFLAQNVRGQADMMQAITTSLNKKFDPQKYDVKIWGKDSTPELVELAEQVRTSSINGMGPVVVKKDALIKYGKDTKSDYAISMVMYPADFKVSSGLFSVKMRMQWQIETNIANVATDKYIYNKIVLSPSAKMKEAVFLAWESFDKDVILPPEIVK